MIGATVETRLRAGRPGSITDGRNYGIFSTPRIHTGTGAHPASYWMDIADSNLGGKAAEAWNWPLTYT